MSIWEMLGKAAKAEVEGNDPNNHYSIGRDHGVRGCARTIYPVMGDGNNQLSRCAHAYNQGYDDGVRERMLKILG